MNLEALALRRAEEQLRDLDWRSEARVTRPNARQCTESDCRHGVHAKGLCFVHYRRVWWKTPSKMGNASAREIMRARRRLMERGISV